MKLYKLTDQYDRTYDDCQWGEGVTHTTSGKGDLCGPGWIYAYTDPLLAVLFNPIHANFRNPHLWEAEGEIGKNDHGMKVGCTQLTTIHCVPLPKITIEQSVRFAILATKQVYSDVAWNCWADRWLNNSDRSEETAWETAWAAAWAATMAAVARAEQTEKTEKAAWAAARAAAWAAKAAAWEATWAAGWAAAEATEVANFDLTALAHQAIIA